MQRGVILTAITLTVVTASVLMWGEEQPQASIQYAYESTARPVEVPYLDMDLEHLAICHQTHEDEPQPILDVETVNVPVEEENAPESEITCLGTWTCTAYCGCPECCGDYATGYTASGTVATEGRTIACNVLPFGTQVMIDGCVYTVEDTGWSPYGDNWIDIYFDSHEAALNFGVQMKEVYIIGTN